MHKAARSRWPFHGDSPVAIARKVAGAYREALHALCPERCAEVDARMVAMGQTWVRPRVARFGLDDWLTESQSADLIGVEPNSIGAARRRGRLHGQRIGGRWHYRARDVLALSTDTRDRRRAGDNERGSQQV